MDREGLIPIGRFARLTDLSPRFLRKLDERGLLSPAHVDPETRYRYYSPDQTRLAGLVHLAKQLGMTVDQLDDLVAAYATDGLRAFLERRRVAVQARLAEDARLLRLLDLELERGGRPLLYEVALKDQPALLVMSAAGSVPRTHPHDPWALEAALRRVGARALVAVARQGVEPDQHGIVLYHTDLARDDSLEFEVCFPLPRRLKPGPGVECKELPAARVALLVFRGPYDTIWNAHVELLAWVAEHGHVPAGPVRETGLVSDVDSADPMDWVTELSVPIGPRHPDP